MKYDFKLDERLKNDTLYIGALPICNLLLMNDARWPWLILVPRIEGAKEIHHLKREDQSKVLANITKCAKVLEAITKCHKINIAALGNIVQQLHIHIIARNVSDINWPNPVFGFEGRQLYEDAQAKVFIDIMKLHLEIK